MENKSFDYDAAYNLIMRSLEPNSNMEFEEAWALAESMTKGEDEDTCAINPIPEPEPWGTKGTKASKVESTEQYCGRKFSNFSLICSGHSDSRIRSDYFTTFMYKTL